MSCCLLSNMIQNVLNVTVGFMLNYALIIQSSYIKFKFCLLLAQLVTFYIFQKKKTSNFKTAPTQLNKLFLKVSC